MSEILICAYYSWYFLPIVQAILSAGIYKFLFLALFAIGWLTILFVRRKKRLQKDKMLAVVASYILPILCMAALDVADASKTTRVTLTFFLSPLLYSIVRNHKEEIKITKYLILILILTSITSFVGVLINPSAARTISHARADDTLQRSYMLMNIGGSFLYQSLVMFVPAILALGKRYKRNKSGWLIVGGILLILLKVSFTIALFVYLIALFITIVDSSIRTKNAKSLALLSALFVTVLFVIFNMEGILKYFAEHISSSYISERLNDLASVLSNGIASLGKYSDVGLRIQNYTASINTFFSHPLGIGPYYSYIVLDRGIGYHSQILDDLARYGVFGLAFYLFFFSEFYRMMKRQWEKVELAEVAWITTFLYFLFLLSNIGFRSASESMTCFCILPALPNLVIEYNRKRSQ